MLTETTTSPSPTDTAVAACRSCLSKDVTIFHQTNSVPVNSCLLLDDRDSACAYPTGQMALAFCRQCGFIGNVRFNKAMARYTSAYEEQQSFSPRFNTFAKDLAQRWIDRYGMKNKTVLEIGCGKGDFLMLLCSLGPNRGIGIDPSYIPNRQEGSDQVEFIADFYSQRYSHLEADVVCCRHTLEHIPETLEFMTMVRDAIGDRPETLVLFELPDVSRVLKECAFWDIYYEHCSYFSLGSLARLFRRSGFDVLDLSRDYDDQYLLIEAKPASGAPNPPLPAEDDLEDMAKSVTQFRENFRNKVQYWKRTIGELRSVGKRVAIWGSGSKCVAFLNTLGMNEEICAVVDINPHRHGRFLPGTGKRIDSPAVLREYRPDVVVAMNPVYLNEIRADLNRMDLDPELTAV